MALPTILPSDQVATTGAKNTYYNNATQSSGFDKFLNTAAYTAQTFGPLAYATTNAATGGSSTTSTTSAQIVGAAINSAAMNTPLGSTSYATTSGYSPSSSVSIGATGTYGSTTSSSSLSGNVESILQDTAASQAYLLGIQMQMGEQQTMFTSISNAINVRDGMKKMVINNFKV